jgi:hypothetical protein
MSWILDEAEVLLRADLYSTIRLADTTAISFEDDTLFGFLFVYPTPEQLLASWQADQSRLLERFAPPLRSAATKAWNVYSVFLTEGHSANPDTAFQFEAVEENLQHTRKIPRQAIRSPADVKVALSPILSIVGQRVLGAESFDERLSKRLQQEIGQSATNAFLSDTDEELVARTLAESSQ